MIYSLPQYPEMAMKQLTEMRQNNQFCDIVISVNGQEYRAHKAVLAAGSHYMRYHLASLSGNLLRLQLQLTGWNIFEDVLRFIYTGEVELTEQNVAEMTMIGTFLQISDLTMLTSQFLNSMQQISSLPEILPSPAAIMDISKDYSVNGIEEFTQIETYVEHVAKSVAKTARAKKQKKPNDDDDDDKNWKPNNTSFKQTKTATKRPAKAQKKSLPIKKRSRVSGNISRDSMIVEISSDATTDTLSEPINQNTPVKNAKTFTPIQPTTAKDQATDSMLIVTDSTFVFFDKETDKFLCRFCDKTYRRYNSCLQHAKTHKTKPNMCRYCGVVCKTTSLLLNHYRENIVCNQSTKKDPDAYLSKQDFADGFLFKCGLCFARCEKFDFYQIHRKKKHKINEEVLMCSVCNQSYSDNATFHKHIAGHYAEQQQPPEEDMKKIVPYKASDDFDYMCKLCGDIFPSIEAYNEHMKIKCGLKGHQCTFCHKRFTQIKMFEKHLMRQNRGSCGARWKKVRHSENPLLERKKFENADVPNPNHGFFCKSCNKGFDKFATFSTHQLKEHEDDSVEKKCRFCNLVFQEEFWLDNHIGYHVNQAPQTTESLTEPYKFVCPVCEKAFAVKKEFHLHRHKDCARECRFCGYSIQNKILMRKHILKHTVPKPFDCWKCKEAFYLQRELFRHLVVDHSVQMPNSNIEPISVPKQQLSKVAKY